MNHVAPTKISKVSIQVSVIFAILLFLSILLSSRLAHAKGPDDCADLFVPYISAVGKDAGWVQSIKRWIREGHSPEDLERVAKLLREGKVNQAEARAIIENGSTESLERLFANGTISNDLYTAIERAFLRVIVDKPLGKPDRIQTLPPATGTARRAFVLAQEFRGIFEPESDRELVLIDRRSKTKLGSLAFLFEGYRHLSIEHLFVSKNERSEQYAELLFAEILRRYPSIQTISFQLSNLDVTELRKNIGSDPSFRDIVQRSRLYIVSSQFGFSDHRMRINRDLRREVSIAITAHRNL